MRVEELDYSLPEELIAKHPAPSREDSRLLVLPRRAVGLLHQQMRNLPGLLPPSLFVFNDTRVIPARILGSKPSGGRFEILLVERLSGSADSQCWLCMARPLKSLRAGLRLEVGRLGLTIGKRHGDSMVEVTLEAAEGVLEALATVGQIPLPPYISRAPHAEDEARYQTVFARAPGAVAAPTAGLHFGEELLSQLERHGHQRAFVTLHVGPGTFAPLAVEDLREHPMHEEAYEIPAATADAITRARHEGRPIVAVGTTVVRTLEASALQHGAVTAGNGRTNICIYPPYQFRVIDALVTNFHLPRSTLLALVMAFAGIAETRVAYEEAVAQRYRFFSYGDAMLIAGPELLQTKAAHTESRT